MTPTSAPETATNPDSSTRRNSPSLAFSIGFGAISFGLVSVLAYSIWAFRLIPGAAGLYSSTAAVYVVLSGFALSRLVNAPDVRKRFLLLFPLAFIIYAAGWCALWFGLKGKYQADFFGSVAGLAGMTWLLQSVFKQEGAFLRLFLVMLILHSIGYYAGGELYRQFRGPTGRLLWGAAHGLGFGAGLGYVIYFCQRPRKAPSTV